MGEAVGKKLIHGASNKLQAVIVGCGIATLGFAVALYGIYSYKKSHNIKMALQQLGEVTRTRELEILSFFDDQEIKLNNLSKEEGVVAALEQGAAQDKERSRKQKDFLAHYQSMYGYKDILLISIEAKIIFSLNNAELAGLTLSKQPYQTSSLAQSFYRSIMTVTVDISAFEFFQPLGQQALYLCVPVFKNKKMMGVLAVQINDQVVSSIANNYKDLGKTGELLLAVKKENNIRLLLPTRNELVGEPSPIISLHQEGGFALKKSVQGMRGKDIGLDYRQQETIAVWRYLPDVAWGLVTQIDVSEVIKPVAFYYNLFLLGLIMGLAAIALFVFLKMYPTLIALTHQPLKLRKILVSILLIAVGITGMLIYKYKMLQVRTRQKMRQEAQDKVEQAKQQIMAKLEHAEATAQTMADDLGSGRLKREDIKVRMTREMQEYPDLVGVIIAYEPFAYDAKQKLFAPIVVRESKGLEYKMIDTLYDYTQPERPGQPITRWYSLPIRQGAQWSEPYLEPLTNMLVAVYSVPFFDQQDKQKKKPLGIISVMYPIDKIKEIVEDLGIGKTGYGFIISKIGYFLYHPVTEYVQKQKTIFEVADELNNATLREVGDKALHGQKGFANYLNEITAQFSSVYYEPLPYTGWSLGVTFIEEESPIPSFVWRHYQIWILISAMIVLLLAFLLLTKAYIGKAVWEYSIICSGILGIGVLILWILVYQAASIEQIAGIPIVDKVGLNKFVDSINRQAANNHETLPLTIPTGIYLRSINISGMQAEFTADIWQRYDKKKHANIKQGVTFPRAISVQEQETYRETTGDSETIGWTVKGVLAQSFDYSKYPFDVKNVEIALAAKEKIKNVLLIPDFESYRLLSPTTKPGIDDQVKVLGFSVRKSIFSFDTQKPKVNFGIEEAPANKTLLNFNSILRRNLVDATVVYLLPLLVILVALYASLWFTYEDQGINISYRALAAYTAVVFSLVLLHRTFRDKLPSGEIIYLEYFFLFTYVTIVILILDALVMYSKMSLRGWAIKSSYLLRFLYWPLEVLAWLSATIIIFYN
jgi:hypothetical protein